MCHYSPKFLFFLLLISSSITYAIQPVSEGDVPEDDVSSDQFLTGQLISFVNGNLITSVGNFQIPSTTRILDRRINKEAETKVQITLHNNLVRQVIIYQ